MGKNKRKRGSKKRRNQGTRTLSLALAMIVKDEEAMLADCLSSVQGLAGQLVVVDTGSTDKTAEIARSAGAQVVDFPWCDDFSAARNAALAHITSDWVLMLDADERLGPGAAAAIREAIASDSLDCGFLPLLNASRLDALPADVLSGAALRGEPTLLPRLFRRSPELRWEGIVHESVGAWIEQGPQRCARVNAPIIHLGNVESFRVDQGKSERNLRLLRKQVELQPDSPPARAYLARELIRAGDERAADAQVAEGWDLALRAWDSGEGPSSRPAVVPLASLRAFRALTAGALEVVVETADAVERWEIVHPNLLGMRGMALQRLACAAHADAQVPMLLRAATDLGSCLELHGQLFADEVMSGITSWVAATELGVVSLLLQEPGVAREAFEAALGASQQHRDALFGRVEALLDLGEAQDALAALEPLLGAGGADEWALGAAICRALGSSADAEMFARRATELGPVGASHPYRRLRYSS